MSKRKFARQYLMLSGSGPFEAKGVTRQTFILSDIDAVDALIGLTHSQVGQLYRASLGQIITCGDWAVVVVEY